MNLVQNGELVVKRNAKHGKGIKATVKSMPTYTTRMEKREYLESQKTFDVRNVLDVKSFLNNVSDNWKHYLAKVRSWVKTSPVGKIFVSGVFTIVLLGSIVNSASAAILEYTYQMKNTDTIENVAKFHGVTPTQIMNINGDVSVGDKIILPKVTDKVVTADALNIRSQADIKSNIIGKLKNGDVVKTVKCEPAVIGWEAILIEGRVAFVSSEYVTTSAKKTTTANDTAKSTKTTKYKIKSGDYFYKLAKDLNISTKTLEELNPGVDSWNLKIGQVINVPADASSPSSSKKVEVKETKTGKEVNTTKTTKYKIKSGDYFYKLAKDLNISTKTLEELNPGVDSWNLKIGQVINIPSNAKVASEITNANVVEVEAFIGGVDSDGTFRFITKDGATHVAKAASDAMKNELFSHQGETHHLTLEAKRGQSMTLIAIR